MTRTGDHEYDGFDLDELADLVRYQRWIVDSFAPYIKGDVAEFGAGQGSISALLLPHATSLILVEPSEKHAARLRDRFSSHPHVRIHSGPLEREAATLDERSIDCVVLVNVLEHIENDAAALDHLHRILKPGGHLCLMVPALPSLFSKMDVRLGHYRRYTRKSLAARVTDAGFEIIRGRYMDVLGVFPWWLINTILGQTSFNPKLVSVYDRLFVPIGRAAESLVPAPIGKNLMFVARRPA